MALIAPFARVARFTNRSTPYHGDHQMPVTERHRGQGLDKRELRQAGDVVDLDCPPFFIDRVEDAVASGPQAPQIRRPIRERLGRPRLIGKPANSIPECSDTDGILAEETRLPGGRGVHRLVQRHPAAQHPGLPQPRRLRNDRDGKIRNVA